ncbi:MAG: tetratricopeptide repeat protein [Gammaproteobacteria bacterium]
MSSLVQRSLAAGGVACARACAGGRLAAVVVAFVVTTPAAWGVVYDPAQNPASAQSPTAAANPQAQAALDAGLAALKEAEGIVAAEPTPTSGKLKALSPALKKAYTQARAQLLIATRSDPALAQAWNGLGYSQRKLGDYSTALASYGRALELKPGYPEATEYRGEAFLGLNRIEDAKQAYLDLFASNRSLAARLLGAMTNWIGAQKTGSEDAADLARFVEERTKIASQTASLTRESAASKSGW